MNRKSAWQWLVVLGMGGLNVSALASLSFGQASDENQDTQMVDTLFRTLCGGPADPASLGYYLTALEEGRQTRQQVHDSVAKTCKDRAEVPCDHVLGLQDLCASKAKS